MGCDIHALVERKVGERWVMITRLDNDAVDRNYSRFAALAGVRGDGPAAKGLPLDLSEGGRLYADEWGDDAHNSSFALLPDIVSIFLATEHSPSDYAKTYPCDYFFNVPQPENHRLVFWFDN